MKTKYLIFIIILTSGLRSSAQRLHSFTSESEAIVSSGTKERVPYNRQLGFYNFISENTTPSQVTDSIPAFDLYFYLPIAVKEIGLRLITPVPENVFADAGDIVTPEFEKYYSGNSQIYFDPFISLEQGFVDSNNDFIPILMLGENDNSKENIAQPSGKFNNSLLRVVSTSEYPSGVYRIRITTIDKEKKVQGSYLLTLGLVPGLKNIMISENLSELVPE